VSVWSLIWGVCSALAVNECCDLSPWAARKIARWSAHLRYTDSDRAETRAEELAAVIDDRPGKLFKLITALCLAGAAIRAWIVRAAIRAWAARATADVSLISITPAGQVTLRKAIAASALTAAATFAVLEATPAVAPTTSADTIVIPLHAPPGSSAAGEATVHHTAYGWSVQLTVHGLKDLGPDRFYETWFACPGSQSAPYLVAAGTFIVGPSGSATCSMCTGADPLGSAMDITSERPGNTGQHGEVILSGFPDLCLARTLSLPSARDRPISQLLA
jgi:hypothetical protein